MSDTELESIEVEVIEVVSDDFESRVEKLLALIQQDDGTRDRMMVEMYLALTDLERGMRTMIQHGGPMGILKAMMGKNGT